MIYKNEDNIIITFTIKAQIISDADTIEESSLYDIIYDDPAYGLKSIIVGRIDETSEDHDIELLLNEMEIDIKQELSP